MNEVWKIAVGTNDKYEVSNFGNIRRVPGFVKNNINGGKRKVGGKNMSPKTKSNGYLEVSLTIKTQESKSFYVHRLVASTFIGDIPKGYNVNHKDGVKSNNHISNLEIITCSENMLHAHRELGIGKFMNPLKGEDCHFSTFKREDIIKIRELYDSGTPSRDISIMFDRSLSTIRKICYRATWKHIK